MFQEREEQLLKQLKANIGDEFDLSSLTLDKQVSPVEEVPTNTSSTKVSPAASCDAVKPCFHIDLRCVSVCVAGAAVLICI